MPGSDPAPGWIPADWPAPPWVRAGTSTRIGGASRGPYASLNLADHVGDRPGAVAENRRRLAARLRLPAEPAWLRQVHGASMLAAHAGGDRTADASWTDRPATVCAVLTADCLPLLLCDRDARRVAAVHVGWRGLAAGIIAGAVAGLGRPSELLAWLGPCIGPAVFEVGPEVYQACRSLGADRDRSFRPNRAGHWLLDLPGLVRSLLGRHGVPECHGGNHCTYTEERWFYSFRRDGRTGRMASLIWIDEDRA